MFKESFKLLLLAMLYASDISAVERETIYIHSDEIVPYQEPAVMPDKQVEPVPQSTAPAETQAAEQVSSTPLDNDTSLQQHNAASEEENPIQSSETNDPTVTQTTTATNNPPFSTESETRAWLNMQSSGELAGNKYKLAGQTATQIYQRYLKSFTHPIPAEFNNNKNSSGSASIGSR